jgi:hypothetical protein
MHVVAAAADHVCRGVQKPQPMLAYTNSSGGNMVKNCIVGRWREYKWYGCSDRVFRCAPGKFDQIYDHKV